VHGSIAQPPKQLAPLLSEAASRQVPASRVYVLVEGEDTHLLYILPGSHRAHEKACVSGTMSARGA
jgi:hypothetical protein